MFERLLVAIASALDKAGIPYMVVGGQAVLRYGEPRATKDIDVTVGLGIEGIPRILAVTKALGFKPLVKDISEFARRTMVIPVQEKKGHLRIDFILSYSPYERQAIERAKAVRLGRVRVRYATLEDLVIHKIIAGRDRDLEDVASVLLRNPKAQVGYIESWLKDFDKALDAGYLACFRTVARNLGKKAPKRPRQDKGTTP